VDHKLVPLRKGVFRMALQAAVKNDFKDNISFITAGINYDHPTDSRKDVMVHFGTPFFLNEYKEDYCQNPAGTLLKMTKRGYEVLEKKVLHINDPKQYALAEKCLANYNDQYSFYINSWQQATIKKFEGAKEICNRINAMSEKELEQLQIEATNYKRVFSSSTPSFTKQLIKVITFPFFILAYLFNAPPILLAKRIADKKVHRPDYYSWVFVVCSMVLYIIWLIILFLGILLFLPLLQDLIK
jgi:hypothetical protein